MNDNKVTIVGLLFLVLCLGLIGGIYYLDGHIRELREEYNELERRRVNLEQDRRSLQDQINVFNNAFRVLRDYNVRAATSEMDFYAQVQNVIDPYIMSNELIITSARQNPIRDGRGSQALTLRGDYYAFLRVLAAWRNLQTTVRIAQLSVTASRTPTITGEVQADVVLEAIISPN